MILKMTNPNILFRDIQNPTEKDNSVSKRFERSQNFTSFVETFKSQLKKTVHYRNDYKDYRTLHSLWGHSNSNWKRQFSIEMITKMRDRYILCGDIQIPTENAVQYWNDSKDHRTLHPLWGHSSFNWKNKQFGIEMISKMTEPCILCRDIHFPT